MTNYATLIDAPTWAFIRATGATYPPEIATLTIADQRAIYDRMCRAFFQGYPAGITAQDQTLAGVNCRIYPGLAPTAILMLTSWSLQSTPAELSMASV